MGKHSKKRASTKGLAEGLRCPDCGSNSVKTTIIDHRFPFGDGETAVELSAQVPLRKCLSCEFEYLDYEAEAAEEAAVRLYLQVMRPTQLQELRKLHDFS